MSPAPPLILISGLPRSGTTWLGKLFDSHPRVLYRHEPDSVFPLKWLPTVINDAGVEYAERVRAFVAAIPKIRDAKVSASQPMFAKTFIGARRRFLMEQSLRVAKLVEVAGGKMPIPSFCLPHAQSDFVLTWKTIESCGRLHCFIHALQPVRVIQILRHPGGVTASQLRGKRLNKFNGYDQAVDFNYFKLWLETDDAAALATLEAMSEVERLTWLHLVRMKKALHDLSARSACRIVVYEDLCARPAEVLTELFSFCGLELSEQTERFLRESTSKTDNRYFGLFKDSAESAHKWKTELPPAERSAVERMVADSSLAHYWAGMR